MGTHSADTQNHPVPTSGTSSSTQEPQRKADPWHRSCLVLQELQSPGQARIAKSGHGGWHNVFHGGNPPQAAHPIPPRTAWLVCKELLKEGVLLPCPNRKKAPFGQSRSLPFSGQEARRCYGACCPPGPPPRPVRAWSGVPTILGEFLVGAGCLRHGEEGIGDVREEGVQVKVLPTPWLLFLITKQHGHHIAEKLVAPFLRWPPDILILHEMEAKEPGGHLLWVESMPGSSAALPCTSHTYRSIYHSKASHLAPWCLQKGESVILRAWHPIPLGLSHPGAFMHPSPKLPSAGVCIASPFCPLPTLPRLTCFGLESSPSRVDLRSWKERTAGVTPRQGRQGGQGAGQSQGQGRSGQRSGAGSLEGSAWPPRVHICLYSTGSGLSSCRSGGTGAVWQCEAASALPARGTHGLYRSRASSWGGDWTMLHPKWQVAKVVVPTCPTAGTWSDVEPPGTCCRGEPLLPVACQ